MTCSCSKPKVKVFCLHAPRGCGCCSSARARDTVKPDMPQEEMPALGRRFFVNLTGRTNDAHESFLAKFMSAGHIQVNNVQDCDYCLVFCPVATRVGTDIDEALENIPSDRPVILVVMHHTFDRHHVVVDSSRLVTKPNVHLTVDCLFYERDFLKCSHNDMAWHQIQKCLGIVKKSSFNSSSWKMFIGGAVVLTGIIIIILALKFSQEI